MYSLNCTGYSLLSAFMDLVSMAQTVIASTKHIGLNRAEIEQQKDILVAVDSHGVCHLSHALLRDGGMVRRQCRRTLRRSSNVGSSTTDTTDASVNPKGYN